MATPDFVLDLREKIGTAPLWLSGVCAVVVRPGPDGGGVGTEDGAGAGASAGTAADEVLLVKRSDTGAWTPVTGIIDPGEEPAVAGRREVLEEADVEATPERLVLVQVTAPVTYDNGDRSQYLELVFRFRYDSGTPFPADGENTEARWFSVDALPAMSEAMMRGVRAALENRAEAVFAS
ncbi:NUDIX hydrolase [Frondihabitans cladoniiphilus]|uniref:NUDIX domain-containing protein n=1 Tax=Frondihabitans cladoniiphilus TaxID=715785 RepID=A0ABP8W5G6_9MICO